jgi:hypothetical protein
MLEFLARRKKGVKLSLFAADKILSLKDTKGYTPKI